MLALLLCAERPQSARGQDGLPPPTAPAQRRPIVVGLPVPEQNSAGELVIEPNVDFSGQIPPNAQLPYGNLPLPPSPPATQNPARPTGIGTLLGGPRSGSVIPAGATMPASQVTPGEPLTTPPPTGGPLEMVAPPSATMPQGTNGYDPIAQPLFSQLPCASCGGGSVLGSGDGSGGGPPGGRHGGTFYGLGGVEEGSCEPGIGHERVMFAPFLIDTTQPESNMRFRFTSIYDEIDPDRVEYLWGHIGVKGPTLPEKSVDYQELRSSWEVALGKAFSITTEVPLDVMDPEINPNRAGLGDVSVTTKTLLLNGNNWQITQILRCDVPTGTVDRGLGTGHVSLEPGLLFRYKWTAETYFHGELEYWFPLGGDPTIDGQVLQYGFGISHLLYETDNYAIIPTLEFVGWTVFDGA